MFYRHPKNVKKTEIRFCHRNNYEKRHHKYQYIYAYTMYIYIYIQNVLFNNLTLRSMRRMGKQKYSLHDVAQLYTHDMFHLVHTQVSSVLLASVLIYSLRLVSCVEVFSSCPPLLELLSVFSSSPPEDMFFKSPPTKQMLDSIRIC